MTLLETLEKLIAEEEATGKTYLIKSKSVDYYSSGLNEDGVPYNIGNYDDVYGDGFNAGDACGRFEFAHKLATVISLFRKMEQ